MRKGIAVLAAIGCTLAAGVASAAAISVEIDQSKAVTLGGSASSVLVGNPSIADVTVLDRRHLAILGRSAGSTSVTALDGNGRTIYSGVVLVSGSEAGKVQVFRGGDVYNYACASRCERAPQPGERDTVYNPYAGPVSNYAGQAKTQSSGGGGG